jgi:nucleoside-diphosphate-sugar epimerase
VVPLLLAAGHTVRTMSRHPSTAEPGVEPVVGDLLSTDLSPVVDGCEAVVHAATSIPRHLSAPGAWDLNTRLRTLGTRRLVEAAQAAGVERYVQQSIIMVYADGGEAWLDENAAFDSSSSRASTVEPVQEMESLVRASSLDWCILRGGQFAGPGTAQDFLLEALESRTAAVPCDGSYFISPVHPADLASAVAAALDTDAPVRSVFNIVSEPITYAEYVDRLADLRRVPRPMRDPSRACPASQRCTAAAAHQHLGWHPTHSIWPEPR